MKACNTSPLKLLAHTVHAPRPPWFDLFACGLFAVLALGGLFVLPWEVCVLRSPDGATTVLWDMVADPPTGDPTISTVYPSWPLLLLFAADSIYYFVRASRADPAGAGNAGMAYRFDLRPTRAAVTEKHS